MGFCSCTCLLVQIPFLFCVRGLFVIFRVQAAVQNCRNCRNCQHCCALTAVKYVKEICETAHSIPKETCDKVARFKQQKQPVFRGKTRTRFHVQECDLELGKFVEHLHVLSKRCLRRDVRCSKEMLATPQGAGSARWRPAKDGREENRLRRRFLRFKWLAALLPVVVVSLSAA